MSYIGKNIKKIRSVKKLSQSQFGDLFGLNRGAVGAYEEERSEPKIESLMQIASHFNLSIDILLTKELTTVELYKFNILNKKMDEAHHFSDSPNIERKKRNVALVTSVRSLEYLANHNSKDFISKLNTIDLPTNTEAICRAFELEGSEMEYNQNGLHHGDILLTEEVKTSIQTLELGHVYTIITLAYIKTRRLSEIKEDTLVFASDDPNYLSSIVNIKDITQIWKVIGAYSTYLNPPKMIEERVMLLETQIESILNKLIP
ncbi:MAG: helix-turn-helix domain-containing protein [Reichenbachiella sp.]